MSDWGNRPIFDKDRKGEAWLKNAVCLLFGTTSLIVAALLLATLIYVGPKYLVWMAKNAGVSLFLFTAFLVLDLGALILSGVMSYRRQVTYLSIGGIASLMLVPVLSISSSTPEKEGLRHILPVLIPVDIIFLAGAIVLTLYLTPASSRERAK